MALFRVDDESGIPIWIQLRNRLIYLIDSDHYREGDKLPTVRALAEELHINYHTVNKVYTELEHEGYLKAIRGKGAFVQKKISDEKGLSAAEVVMIECVRQCKEFGMTTQDIKHCFERIIGEERG